jgi:hypothetical protein
MSIVAYAIMVYCCQRHQWNNYQRISIVAWQGTNVTSPRKPHNNTWQCFNSSPNIIRQIKSRRMRWVGHVACMGRKVYRVWTGKPEGRRPLGRTICRWEGGIRMDLRATGEGSVKWIQMAQDRGRWWALVNTEMNHRVLAPQSWLYRVITTNI